MASKELPMRRRLMLALLAPLAFAAGPSFADDADAPLATGAANADDQIAAYLRDLPPPEPAPWSGAMGPLAPFDDRRPHGEVGVAIGNHGYRSVYARSTMPVGKTGTLDVAVAHSKMNASRRFGGGSYGGTSLSVGLDFSRPDLGRCSPEEIPVWRRDRTLSPSCGGPPLR
jgi:hypothetical protein